MSPTSVCLQKHARAHGLASITPLRLFVRVASWHSRRKPREGGASVSVVQHSTGVCAAHPADQAPPPPCATGDLSTGLCCRWHELTTTDALLCRWWLTANGGRDARWQPLHSCGWLGSARVAPFNPLARCVNGYGGCTSSCQYHA